MPARFGGAQRGPGGVPQGQRGPRTTAPRGGRGPMGGRPAPRMGVGQPHGHMHGHMPPPLPPRHMHRRPRPMGCGCLLPVIGAAVIITAAVIALL